MDIKLDGQYFIVIDERNNVWERDSDFKNSDDYFDKDISSLIKEDLLSFEDATAFKNELDREIASSNNIKFKIQQVDVTVEFVFADKK